MGVTVNFHLDPVEPPHSTLVGTQLNPTEFARLPETDKALAPPIAIGSGMALGTRKGGEVVVSVD
jgi:hypothetical protein